MAHQVIFLAVVAALSPAVTGSAIHNNAQNFLGVSKTLLADMVAMQPETVAKTLLSVEDEWKDQATNFLKIELSNGKVDEANGPVAPESFSKSCETVVGAIVKGSDGDTEVTKEYMTDVCSQPVMTAWRRETCIALAKDVAETMTASAYENRVNFHAKQACDDFWSHFITSQKALHQKELDAMKAEEAEKKKQEEEEKAEQERKMKEETEKRKSEEDARKKAAAQKDAELEALREKLQMNATKEKEEVEEKKEVQEKAEVEAVEAAADEKLKEATQEGKGSKDTPQLANETPDMQRAYAVLKAADAMTTEKDITSVGQAVETVASPAQVDVKASVATQPMLNNASISNATSSSKEVEKSANTTNNTKTA